MSNRDFNTAYKQSLGRMNGIRGPVKKMSITCQKVEFSCQIPILTLLTEEAIR